MYVLAKWPHNNKNVALIVQSAARKDPFDSIFSPNPNNCAEALDCQGSYVSDLLDVLIEQHRDIEHAVIVKNPACILSDELLTNTVNALTDLEDRVESNWALCTPSGLSIDNKNLMGSYYSHLPGLPTRQAIGLVKDTFIDFYVVNLNFYKTARKNLERTTDGFELSLICEGILRDTGSYFHPALSVGVDSMPMARDINKVREDLTKVFANYVDFGPINTFVGQITEQELVDNPKDSDRQFLGSLSKKHEAILLSNCGPVSLSIVTRTCFARIPYLKRLLASVVRAVDEESDIELIIASDIEPEKANSVMKEIKHEYADLNLNYVDTSNEPGVSRVRNLTGGINAATKEYVWIVDDDDYITADAITQIRQKLLLGAKPFIFASSDVVNEQWFHDESGSVLESSVPTTTYHAKSWKFLFGGSNQVPICGFISPREHIIAQIAKINLAENLSEDYALLLALLASTELPRIDEIETSISKISVRQGEDNTVNMIDRRPWTRDIHGFLTDILQDSRLVDEGFWNLLVARNEVEQKLSNAVDDQLIESNKALVKRNRELKKSVNMLQNEMKIVRESNSTYVKIERRAEPDMRLQPGAKESSSKAQTTTTNKTETVSDKKDEKSAAQSQNNTQDKNQS